VNKFITRAVNHLRYSTHVIISDDDFIKVIKEDTYAFDSMVNNSLDWDILASLILNSFSLHVIDKRWPTTEEFSNMSEAEFDAFNEEFKQGCIEHGFGYAKNNHE